MRLMISFLACSFLIGCASVERPDGYVYGFNHPAMKLRGYNIKKDFNSDGTRKKNSVPKEVKLNSCSEINGYIMQSPQDWEKTLVWIRQMREAYEDLRKDCGK